MHTVIEIARLAAVLLAATLLGKWFLQEVRRVRAKGRPIYEAYISIPGLLILLVLLTPVLIRMFK